VASLAEHLQKIPSIHIFGIFQCENHIRLLDQIRTQHPSLSIFFKKTHTHTKTTAYPFAPLSTKHHALVLLKNPKTNAIIS
jgi:hypothetical protein